MTTQYKDLPTGIYRHIYIYLIKLFDWFYLNRVRVDSWLNQMFLLKEGGLGDQLIAQERSGEGGGASPLRLDRLTDIDQNSGNCCHFPRNKEICQTLKIKLIKKEKLRFTFSRKNSFCLSFWHSTINWRKKPLTGFILRF